MSELIDVRKIEAKSRLKFLATASAIALLGCSHNAVAESSGGESSTVWIELGGQLSQLDQTLEPFSPTLMAGRSPKFSPPAKFEGPPRQSLEENGKITLNPSGSDWSFSASVRFGRSTRNKDVRQGTHPKPFVSYPTSNGVTIRRAIYPIASQFAGTTVKNSEKHLIVDFQAGRDVGLGLFGGHGSSELNLGVRFAQFSSKSNIALQSDPDWHFTNKYLYGINFIHQAFHTTHAILQAERNFHGIGPSLSWSGSAPVVGSPNVGEISFDAGASGAILFGRQRARIHHQVTGEYRPPVHNSDAGPRYITYQPPPVNETRSHSVAVPNIGAFAGLTYRLDNFKVSAGYRADFFFGAMDGGIDARSTNDIGFFGPFASVRVGL